MGPNRVFFPQLLLDEWLSEGKVDLQGEELTLLAEARRYRIIEAARVLREVSSLPDANELVGKVKSHPYLTELGAELLETSMVLGDNAYDVVPGFLATPIGSFAEHVAVASHPDAASDEDLLARFLLQRMGSG